MYDIILVSLIFFFSFFTVYVTPTHGNHTPHHNPRHAYISCMAANDMGMLGVYDGVYVVRWLYDIHVINIYQYMSTCSCLFLVFVLFCCFLDFTSAYPLVLPVHPSTHNVHTSHTQTRVVCVCGVYVDAYTSCHMFPFVSCFAHVFL